MQQAILRQTIQHRIWCVIATILVATMPALSQESRNSWRLAKDQPGVTEISARSEISAPQGAGFATLKIRHQPGVNPPVIFYLIIESPKRLPSFPFDKYDGPVDKTKNEFIRLEIAPGGPGKTKTIMVPNGDFVDLHPTAFVFDSIDKGIVPFLLGVGDGQRLNILVNGPPSSIRVAFDTTGLKGILDQVGLKTPTKK